MLRHITDRTSEDDAASGAAHLVDHAKQQARLARAYTANHTDEGAYRKPTREFPVADLPWGICKFTSLSAIGAETFSSELSPRIALSFSAVAPRMGCVDPCEDMPSPTSSTPISEVS